MRKGICDGSSYICFNDWIFYLFIILEPKNNHNNMDNKLPTINPLPADDNDRSIA
jgi:hypothetical protein